MTNERKRIAVFMAFGTKGDVYPIAALCAAYAGDQGDYNVFFVTHSAHEDLSSHLAAKGVVYVAVSSPPVLTLRGDEKNQDDVRLFEVKKRRIIRKHRDKCVAVIERIFGDGQSLKGDFMVINFFALEGWSLAEKYEVRCVVAAPYVVPYSAPSTFERQFREEFPSLYTYFQTAPNGKVSWKDVNHWMWPLFTEEWGSWRTDLHLSSLPYTDPVTDAPNWHDRSPSPLLLYGFSEEVVECPGYWPSNVCVCGFWFPPVDWQFSCTECRETCLSTPLVHLGATNKLCSAHVDLQIFITSPPEVQPPIFVGLSSIGSMGFLKNPRAFLCVLQSVTKITNHRFILFSAGYEPLDMAVQEIVAQTHGSETTSSYGISLFESHLFYFSGSVPYDWLFPKCLAAIHHGGSGSTSAALRAGIPQVICPFILDQFYWAERMSWLGVAPDPLRKSHLLPDSNDTPSITEAANALSAAITFALSSKVKAQASKIAARITHEAGICRAVRTLKEEVMIPL